MQMNWALLVWFKILIQVLESHLMFCSSLGKFVKP